MCPFNSESVHYVSLTKERVFVVDMNRGTFQLIDEFTDDFQNDDGRYVLKLEQKFIKQLDFFTRQENWNLVSSEIYLVKYETFIKSPAVLQKRNNYSSSPSYFFTKMSENKL